MKKEDATNGFLHINESINQIEEKNEKIKKKRRKRENYLIVKKKEKRRKMGERRTEWKNVKHNGGCREKGES